MSKEADHIKEQFPDKKMWFLTPRELDKAIVMVEEGVDPELDGHLRVVYQKELVMTILYAIKWPINRIYNFLRVARSWSLSTKRAPAILDQGELEQLLSGGGYDCDGDCTNCDNRH